MTKLVPKDPAKAMTDFDRYVCPSSTRRLSKVSFDIYAFQGAGKTAVSLTISEQLPREWWKRTPASKPVVIEDVVHIGWDNDALALFLPHKVDVRYSIDMNTMMANNLNFDQADRKCRALVEEAIKRSPGITAVIVDTVSVAGAAGHAYFDSLGGDDQRVWGKLKNWHLNHFYWLMTLGPSVSVVCLFHTKILEPPRIGRNTDQSVATAQAEIRKAQKAGDSEVQRVPAIDGNGGSFYATGCTLEMELTAKRVPKKKEYVRMLHPWGTDGGRAKNRFQHILDENEPADLRLLKEKILKDTGAKASSPKA